MWGRGLFYFQGAQLTAVTENSGPSATPTEMEDMIMKKKGFVKAAAVILSMAMLLGGCGSAGGGKETTGAVDVTEGKSTGAGETIKVAVVKQMDHASLDEIADAVTAELDAIAAQEGTTIEYEVYSGQNDQSTLKQIGDQAIAEDADVIIPIATLSAQVMAVCAE